MQQTYPEHPEDVLSQWLDWHEASRVALVVVTGIEGGAVRAPGALMAVREDGAMAGYISGGCIDSDVALQAQNALRAGKAKQLRYGAGSPFTDLPLPCGGAIEVTIIPDADLIQIKAVRDQLSAREAAQLNLEALGDFRPLYVPKPRLRIAGRGADCLALARVAVAAGLDIRLQLRDGEDVAAAAAQGFADVTALETPSDIPTANDDEWTAFILMFHDTHWEGPLLKQALEGPAFYIGAVGSRKTHARRTEALKVDGIDEVAVARIRGPIGLIPSMRDASMLAISVLAEVVASYHDTLRQPFAEIAIILLAAGQSKRFERGDKLLAELEGKPVVEHVAGLLKDQNVAARVAVTGTGDKARTAALNQQGWDVVENSDAAEGQATSLSAGIRAAKLSGAKAALILLGDMPYIGEDHLRALQKEVREGRRAVMSQSGDILCPPAIFHKTAFDDLMALSGDAGAKSLFAKLPNTALVDLSPDNALDIDTLADLERAKGLTHA
ncbi:MAG: NTP transferase domain-containing protein [Henriciella sp.]|nr:NTP transferase domain-containing protein [Henriciella sp.]